MLKCCLMCLLVFSAGVCSAVQAAPKAQDAVRYPAPIQSLVSEGLVIKGSLPAPRGYKGYLAYYSGRPVPIYLLPDRKYAMIGTLFDAAGNDLTSEPMAVASAPVLDAATWTRLGKSTWIPEGSADSRHIVYVFTDTECPYCHRLWEATQPLVAQGNIQIRHVIVGVIAPQSVGRAAAILDAGDPAAAFHRHEQAFGHSPIVPLQHVPKAVAKRIHDNNALMASLGIMGTPGIVYKDAQGKIRIAAGMQSADRIMAIFGR